MPFIKFWSRYSLDFTLFGLKIKVGHWVWQNLGIKKNYETYNLAVFELVNAFGLSVFNFDLMILNIFVFDHKLVLNSGTRPISSYFTNSFLHPIYIAYYWWFLCRKLFLSTCILDPKGCIFRGFRRQGRRRIWAHHIPAPDIRTNLCSFSKIFIKIESKSKRWQPKSTGHLENSRPLFVSPLQHSLFWILIQTEHFWPWSCLFPAVGGWASRPVRGEHSRWGADTRSLLDSSTSTKSQMMLPVLPKIVLAVTVASSTSLLVANVNFAQM